MPFFIGGFWDDQLSEIIKDFPNDVCDCWEMDRQEAGWFFDKTAPDDWGCIWERTEVNNMGYVVGFPLSDWSKLDSLRVPNPRNPFYYERIEDTIKHAGDKCVILTSHFALFGRFHMLRGFAGALEDFYLEPEKTHKLLDMILEYQVGHLDEAARRFGGRVNGIFFTEPFADPRESKNDGVFSYMDTEMWYLNKTFYIGYAVYGSKPGMYLLRACYALWRAFAREDFGDSQGASAAPG